MTAGESHKSTSESEMLADAKAMLAAAKRDKAVEKELGAAYLKHVADDVAHGEALLTKRPSELATAHEDGARVKELTRQAIARVEALRKRGHLANLTSAKLDKLAVGRKLDEDSPGETALVAKSVAESLDADAELAKSVKATPQVRHDLEHAAAALADAHDAHGALRKQGKSDTIARRAIFAALHADAPHIRLAAHIAHPDDEQALAAFESPIPAHVVKHRAKPTPPPATPAT